MDTRGLTKHHVDTRGLARRRGIVKMHALGSIGEEAEVPFAAAQGSAANV